MGARLQGVSGTVEASRPSGDVATAGSPGATLPASIAGVRHVPLRRYRRQPRPGTGAGAPAAGARRARDCWLSAARPGAGLEPAGRGVSGPFTCCRWTRRASAASSSSRARRPGGRARRRADQQRRRADCRRTLRHGARPRRWRKASLRQRQRAAAAGPGAGAPASRGARRPRDQPLHPAARWRMRSAR